ncbi:DKNYY domain-containing protein [Fodinibius halophilus]|uniref:DKNYY domain-containing protein n=1 Tax=Fodinibius halophilus TaxID=1736908 RepID=A0A6M1TAZ3_9BACT|nr:DKNYY domain-containing protein [Fodinibius halophilus]NGP88124.1 hypothetical protein [Fodinibius halophilus]
MNWIVSFALLAWPLCWISSVMLFGGPGAGNNLSNYIIVMVCLSYPVIIFGVYWLFGWSFFNISGRMMFIGSVIGVCGLLFASGYPQAAWNLSQGILNEGYSVSGGEVYYNGEALIGAEAASFKILSGLPSSLKERAPYAKDSNHVYYRGTELNGIDASTFTLLPNSTNYLYAKDKFKVFYADSFDDKIEFIEEADPATFSVINEEHPAYWRDEQYVYYEGQMIPGADPDSFKPAAKADQHYWVDDTAVYFNGEVIPEAVPENFRSLTEEPYHYTQSLEQNGESYVYWRGQRIPSEAPSSFTVLNYEFSMDKARVFYKAEPIITGHNFGTFKLLEDAGYLAVDARHVYNLSKDHAGIIEGADPNTIAVLGKGYLKDHQRVYYRADYKSGVQEVEGANAKSFEVIDYDVEREAEARDNNHYYHNGAKVASQE